MTSATKEGHAITLRGVVETVYFSNTRFSAGRLRTQDGERVSFAGPVVVHENAPVVLAGAWERHPKYGRQFKATSLQHDLAPDVDGLARYLANHPDLEGIGPVKARRIAEAFGADFERALAEEPEEVARVGRIAPAAVEVLREEWARTRTVNAALTWLSSFGLTYHQVTSLVDAYGNNAVAILKADPYLIVGAIAGFGFKRVDVVARKLGAPKDHPSRLRAGVLHCVDEAIDDGDCWIDYEELLARANEVLVLDTMDSRARIEAALDALVAEEKLACASVGGRFLVARPWLHEQERDLAAWVSRGFEPSPHFADEADIDALVRRHAPELNDGQRAAVVLALRHSQCLIAGGAGSGKAQPLDAKVLTPSGWRAMGDIRVGDEVIGADGRPCRVVGVHPQGEREVFRVTMTDGSSTECCDEHLWLTRSQRDRDKGRPGTVKPLREIRGALVGADGKRNHWIPLVAPVEFAGGELPLHPYALGLLLGDGCFRVPNGCGFSKQGMELIDAMEALLPEGAHLSYREAFEWRIVGNGAPGGNPVVNALRELDLAGRGSPEKFVPERYKLAGAEDRLALLQGLLDTDGSTSGHGLEFSTTAPQLAHDVLFLVRSLGGTAHLARRQTYFTHRGERRPGAPSFRLHICLPTHVLPFRLARKRAAYLPRTKYLPRRAMERVESVGVKRVQCIAVDAADQLYVTDDFIVTHNTFTVAAIARICEARGLDVVLAAPTGKAAKRLEQVVGREAVTLHRLLEFNGEAFQRNRDEPLDADVVIVDEVSMLDVPLAWRLYDALRLGTTALVLVGDHNQLPPVGPGNVLRDLLERRPMPAALLDRVVRQAGVLKENSIAVLAGEVRKTAPEGPDGRRPWYLVDQFTDALAVQRFVLDLFENVLAERLRFDLLADVQLLSPQKKGPLGVAELNVLLQRLVQRKLWGVEVAPVEEGRRPALLLRDKVIQTRNNYRLGVMNGAIGFVTDVGPRPGDLRVAFEGGEVEISAETDDASHLQLAYALTIHKAQGSEFPCAVVLIHKAHAFMHHRNLFYTGVTRAQQVAVVIGDRWGLRNCASKEQVERRKTFLSVLDLPPSAGVNEPPAV
ncbi:MAG: ATP-dependent RecD-like DNA helicase [Planctomycetes bacterium]|nr:ATP-dependent RecD-like DNA helicase [Planctomycetota bacterium]